MAKKFKDRESILESENEKLKKELKEKNRVIRQKNSTIRKLKSEVKTAVDAFLDTQEHYSEISDGKSLYEAIEDANNGKASKKREHRCIKCGSYDLNKISFTGFSLYTCNKCPHKTRVEDECKTEKS